MQAHYTRHAIPTDAAAPPSLFNTIGTCRLDTSTIRLIEYRHVLLFFVCGNSIIRRLTVTEDRARAYIAVAAYLSNPLSLPPSFIVGDVIRGWTRIS